MTDQLKEVVGSMLLALQTNGFSYGYCFARSKELLKIDMLVGHYIHPDVQDEKRTTRLVTDGMRLHNTQDDQNCFNVTPDGSRFDGNIELETKVMDTLFELADNFYSVYLAWSTPKQQRSAHSLLHLIKTPELVQSAQLQELGKKFSMRIAMAIKLLAG